MDSLLSGELDLDKASLLAARLSLAAILGSRGLAFRGACILCTGDKRVGSDGFTCDAGVTAARFGLVCCGKRTLGGGCHGDIGWVTNAWDNDLDGTVGPVDFCIGAALFGLSGSSGV